TWTRSNSASLPCRTATRLITASVSRSISASVASSWTSPTSISTVGSSWRWRARVRCRVGTRILLSAPPERSTSFSQTLLPTKPVAPRTRSLNTCRERESAGRALGTILAEPAPPASGQVFFGRRRVRVGRADRAAEARADRRVAAAEERGVVAAVREHLLDVVARLGERDVLDPPVGVEDRPLAPLARPARAGVVRRRGH